jgi:hypothetical protein
MGVSTPIIIPEQCDFQGNPLKRGGSRVCSPWDTSSFGGDRESPSKKQIRGNESQENRISKDPFF